MAEFLLKFLKFGIVGVSGVIVDFGVTWLFKEQFRLNKYIANSVGFACAVLSNYILNRIWTFHSNDPHVGLQFAKFTVVALIGLAMNNAIIFLLTERRGVKFYTAKLVATGVVVLWNFGANYLFTFK
ncbi:MAG: GtrA family protein [Saprospiraceae bacterium]